MKLLHISDLHIGKRLYEYSLIEDQEYILNSIVSIAKNEAPDLLVIAGDVYDKPIPTSEAVSLFDNFLYSLSKAGIKTAVISGNHDSPERLSFGARLMTHSGIVMCSAWQGATEKLTVHDDFGEVNVYLLPFIKPANLRRFFPDENIESYTDALRLVISHLDMDSSKRNILVTHQLVTGAERSDSEEISVGGSDNVDASVFEGFDYVALGHIHSPQSIGSDKIRYSGTPLHYSFSELKHEKSVTVAEIGEKDSLSVRTVPLTPLRRLRELKGSYDELSLRANYIELATDDYYRIILTDENDVPDAAAINEAVELAKGYEEPETVAFINGVLGSFVRAERGETETPAEEE